MGDEKKPVASFLNRKNAPPGAAPVPAQPGAGDAQPVPEALPQPPPPVQQGAIPAPPPGGTGILSGKFKVPGKKSIMATAPRMSAIAPRGALSGAANVSQALGPAARARTGVFNKPPSPAPVPAKSPSPAPVKPQQAATSAPAPDFQPNRGNAELALQRGLDHFDRGDFEQALDAYNESIQADPSFAMAYNNLGMVLIDLERYDEALHALYGSIQRDENYAEAYNNLGFVLRRLGNDVGAIAAYERFLTLEPDVEEGSKIHAWIESVIADNGLNEIPPLIIPDSEKIAPPVQAAPEPPKIKKMAAWEVAAGDVATAAPLNALGEFEEPVAPVPAAPVAPPAIANIRATQSIPKLKPAVPAIAETVDEKNNRLIALIEKSLDEFEAGNIEESRNLAEQALAVDPDCSEAHTALGKVLVREEKFDDGIHHLERAIELDSLDPAPFYVLGFTLRALERNVEAAEIYERFLQLMPDAADAAKMRQWITHINGIAQADAAGESEEDEFVDNEPIFTETDKLYKDALDRFKTSTPETTIDACEQILTDAPEHVRTRLLLGRAHLRRADYDSAASAFAMALDYQADSSEALYFMGQCEEKRGDSPRALKLYRSYVENHPDGPRVDKLRAWFLSHGVSETGKGLSQQIQCEWCLRFFDENEISLHENKATCNGCLTLMGSTPIQDANSLETVDPSEEKKLQKAAAAAGGGGGLAKKLGLVSVVGGLAALVAVGFFTPYLDPILSKVGIKKNPGGQVAIKPLNPPLVDPGVNNPPLNKDPNTKTTGTPTGPDKINVVTTPPKLDVNFDGTKVKIANAPERDSVVFSRWSWKPELEGVQALDETAQGWKKEYFLKDRPVGMSVEDGTIVWNASELKDFDALKRGTKFTVELTVKGYLIGPEGARKDLFSTTKSFSLSSQFGYELGQEIDVGLANDARNIELADLGGGAGGRLLGVLYGSLNQGGARSIFMGPDGVTRPVQLAEGARYAAACEFDISDPPQHGILAANWKTGEITMFANKGGTFESVASAKFAPGTMAVAAFEIEKGKLAVGTLSSAMGILSIGTYTKAGGFTAPKNVQLPGGGGNSRLIAWKSEKKGPGFLAVMPLAEDQLRFVPVTGKDEKDGPEPIRSVVKEEGVITAAVALQSQGSRRLALVLGGKTSNLVLLEEKGGVFTQPGTKISLPGPGLGAVAFDFNNDGCDDLFVTLRDEVCFYFLGTDDKWTPGPVIGNPGMLGPVALLNIRNNSRPEIAVLNENKKTRLFKPVVGDPSISTKSAAAGTARDK